MSQKPPYYHVRRGRAFFEIGKERAARAGMASSYPLGPDGPRARSVAWGYYAEWRESEGRGVAGDGPSGGAYPPGSLGDWFEAYRKSGQWAEKSSTTREEWEVVWRLYIAPRLAMRALRAISPADFERFQKDVEADHGATIRWRAVKIARALFVAAVKYQVLAVSPALTLPNPTPAPRHQIWLAHEIADLMAAAETINRPAIRLAIWIAWETMMQPVDVRKLTLGERRTDGRGFWFETKRSKTGSPIQNAITDALAQAINEYVSGLGIELPPSAPFLRTRTGHRYLKGRMIHDFAQVRAAAFGDDERRRFQDIRRSANVEAELGGASPEERAAILANRLDKDKSLEATYTPSTVAKSRKIMEARAAGRALLTGERRNAPLQVVAKVGMD